MRYTLLLHYPEMTADDMGPDAWAEGMREFDEYAKAIDAAGVLRSAEVLQPSAVTTSVTAPDGTLRRQDGPVADPQEHHGGTFVIEGDDRDAALGWAAKAPSIGWGTVEIRPTATRFVDGAWTPFAD